MPNIYEKYLALVKNDRNLPALTELSRREILEEIRAAAKFGDNPHMARKAALYISHRYSGRELKDIGKCFGIGKSGVSQNSLRFNPHLVEK